MTSLAFILTSEGVLRVHDALVCLTKFHEVVGLEASEDKVRGCSCTTYEQKLKAE